MAKVYVNCNCSSNSVTRYICHKKIVNLKIPTVYSRGGGMAKEKCSFAFLSSPSLEPQTNPLLLDSLLQHITLQSVYVVDLQ